MQKLNISTKTFKSRISKLSTTVMWDKSFGFAFIIDTKLTNYTPHLLLSGPIFIVNVDNEILPVIQALHEIPEDHILVVNNMNDHKNDALLGDILFTAAKLQKLAGVVVFGKVRDTNSISDIGIPIWAEGSSINAATLGKPSVKFPEYIVLDGNKLKQGDWLVGDGDGLIAIEKENLRVILKSSEFKNKMENLYIRRLNAGNRISELMNLENYLSGKGEIIIDF